MRGNREIVIAIHTLLCIILVLVISAQLLYVWRLSLGSAKIPRQRDCTCATRDMPVEELFPVYRWAGQEVSGYAILGSGGGGSSAPQLVEMMTGDWETR